MDKVYKKLTSLLFQNKNAEQGDKELYEYAIKIVVQDFVNIVITILIGIVFGMIKSCICFTIIFCVLRKFTGGLHTKKYVSCLASSTVILIVSLMIIKYFENSDYQKLFLLTNTLSLFPICILSPFKNINKPLSRKEKKIYKGFSIAISVSLFLIVILLMIKNMKIAYSIGMAINMVSLLLLIAFGKQNVLRLVTK